MESVMASGFESLIRLVISLLFFLFVLAACYFTTLWIGNFQKGKFSKGNIEIMEMHKVGNNKYIQIVRIGRNYYAFSVSKDHMEKIDQIDKEDLQFPEQNVIPGKDNFGQILEKMKEFRNQKDKK